MQQTSKKEQSPPFLPVQHAPIGLSAGRLYTVSDVPFRQGDRPITFLHTHETAEFGVCLEGNGVFMIGGRIYPFRGGDCTFIPAWLPHLARSAEETVSRWYWLSLDAARLLARTPELSGVDRFRGGDAPNLFPAETFPEATRLISELFQAAREDDAFSARRMEALLTLFSIELHRGFRPDGEGGASAVERVRKALDLLLRHYAGPLEVGRLAAACCLSENQFRRVFVRATGKTPQEYWNELRIAMAVSLLRSGTRPLEGIAAACGFPTLSSFNRQFRKFHATSPGRFRRDAATGDAR